ncbi:16S rRNA (adenine(1518)-N(6)/adenine(1519)-N(6))-dimethyltransferase RsmA [Chloroflexi bacterium]|nr:16S rRNA (adenine(1518)-N(6)/adenine(1519)-N(6))-dimethyltransferase RsmA [Chloroflexota bacterium]
MARSFTPAKKSLGQHFLNDVRILNRIIEVSELSPTDLVLEIGPGKGALTKRLLQKSSHVTAIELDKDLIDGPLHALAGDPNLDIIEGDAREVNIHEIFSKSSQFKLVANLPYNAGTNILRRLLFSDRYPKLAVVMLQREVARNITADSGSQNILGVLFQAYYETRYHFNVQPRSFSPKPKVVSGVISLKRKSVPLLPDSSSGTFFTFLTNGFAAPRKQFHNSLSQGLGITIKEVKNICYQLGLNTELRPASIEVREWVSLFEAFIQSEHIGNHNQNT